MPLSTELTEALASYPALTSPPPPAPGVSPEEYARQLSEIMYGPWMRHFGDRLSPDTGCSVSNNLVPVEGGEITVRLMTPAGGAPGSSYPVLVWFHGGGWIVGNLDMDDNYLRTICVELQIAVANVEYRLSPEHQFPAPFDDSYTALKWVAENAASFNISPSKGFLVGGDSAGGNFAASLALKSRDDPFFARTPLTGQYLREPCLVHPLAWPEGLKLDPPSLEVNATVPLVNSADIRRSFDTYGGPPTDPRVSPLLAPSHAGLPAAYVQVMEMDPLRDDGVVYERLLREAGVPTKLVQYPSVVHGTHYGFPKLETSVAVDHDAREGLKWLLSLTA